MNYNKILLYLAIILLFLAYKVDNQNMIIAELESNQLEFCYQVEDLIKICEYYIARQDTAITLHREHLGKCSFILKDDVYVDKYGNLKVK